MSKEIKKYIDAEVELAEKCVAENDLDAAFRHLERSHILGQSITYEHTRVHWLMLKIGWKREDLREIFGQIFRIIGASTKTPFGIYPTGNTGGANVSPFKPMPIAEDLQRILRQAKSN
ncbi:MAG: DUF3703 domain-containing protein [Acidobacteriota bacterium]|jgi:hypothetical protein|nr:DUF3703 domain-containing protein [Acidobacteriota bacterium]